ncbi:SURF1 family protein [Pseudoalteromonas sp. T1lg65]|uniref:SURF1 family protein n=1 Tax=Pseudoalteromonas sp. T1lg65 TaxID=2077101 RepID=UPI003F7AC3A4
MGLSALFKGRAKTPILGALIVALICSGLSLWQWQRAQQKYLIEQRIEAFDFTGERLSELLTTRTLSELDGAKLTLTGQFLPDHYWFLDNQVVNGQVGFDVVSLFKLQGNGQNIVVNLGFVASVASRIPPTIVLPSNTQSFTALIKSNPQQKFTLAAQPTTANEQHILQYIDNDFLSEISGVDLLTILAYSVEDNIGGAKPHYKPVVMSPKKHEAYALQWLLIGLAALFIGWKLAKKEVPNV